MDPAPRPFQSLRELNWRVVIGIFALLCLCLFVYRQLDFVAAGQHRPPSLTFLEEGVGCLAGFCVFPLIYLVAIRFPLRSRAWPGRVLIHLASLCVISVLHTTLIALFRQALFPLFGYADQSYGYLPVRYPMEFAHLFIFYWLGLGLIYLFHEIRFARERELRQSKLEATLAEAQLQNLRLQLEPHFLFNALNAVSAALYENPRTADEMLGRLSDLLRQLLKGDRSQEIPLARELEVLQLYVRVMEARFEQRLQFSLEVEPAVRNALVPQLILQPLVENAFRHGVDPGTFEVHVAVRAALREGEVCLEVCDQGPGFPLDPAQGDHGIGLANTRDRLARLYGGQGILRAGPAPSGCGALVEVRFPYREAGPTAPLAPEPSPAALSAAP